MDDTVTSLVRGAGSRYPRGFIWLIPAWFAILAGVAVLVGTDASSTGQMPFWLGLTEIGGLLVTACIGIAVLATVRHRAFRADRHGIWLGIRTNRKRPKLRQVHLSWPDVAQLRMVPRPYGVLLEITLSPAARIVHRPGPAKQIVLWLGALLMPFVFGRGTPALTMPRLNPPRYQVKICDRSAVDLKLALTAVTPGDLPLSVMSKRSALRLAVQPPGKPLTRPPSAVA